MRVERTAKLSVGVARQRVRQVDKNSVVVGGHLLGRDEKVKVSAKKNACSNADQNSCENILRRPRCAKCCASLRCFSATYLFTRFMTILVISERPTDRNFS